jgi:hypothetical protein
LSLIVAICWEMGDGRWELGVEAYTLKPKV